MSRRDAPMVFRVAPWLMVATVLALAVFMAASGFMYRRQGLSLATWGLLVGSIGTLAGLFDVLTTRVVLHADAIETFARFRRQRIDLADISAVVAEKGTPLALTLAGGGWVKLPELGGRLHPNTLRAWLKRAPEAG